MAQIDNIRRIVAENFKSADQDTVNKLGIILNDFMEQVYNAFKNSIDFTNLNQDVVKATITLDSSGIPTKGASINSSTINSIQGMNVINAVNTQNSTIYPTGGIVCNYTQTGTGEFTLTHVTGIPENQQFTLTIVIYGNNIVIAN